MKEYKIREEEAKINAYNKRLEKLSKNFKKLGQEKTIEQLSGLPENVITELEAITDAAHSIKNEEKLDSVTTPTQATRSVKPKVSKPKGFTFKSLANALTNQQKVDGSDSKRTTNY